MEAVVTDNLPSAVARLDDPDEVGHLGQATIEWLLRQQVHPLALAGPWAVRASYVTFDEANHRYTPNPVGEFALIIGVLTDCSATMGDLDALDLVAWSPRAGQIATRLGAAFALGGEQVGVDGLGTTGLPIPVHRTPLAWLRAGRHGIVIADCDLAAMALRGLILEAEDEPHRRALLTRLTVPPPTIVLSRRRAAA
jgi:hypothetical protein